MDWIEANGAALRYDLAGRGERTLVLVHEMGGTLESWDAVLPVLRQGRRVLRYDTRGAGLSEKIRGTIDLDTMAADIAALLDALDIGGPVAIAGVAVGAAIAIRFAARWPQRTAALIAMGPATGVAPDRRDATLAIADAAERSGMRSGMEAGLDRAYPAELRANREQFARVRAQRLGNDPASYGAIYRMLALLDMREDFACIRAPTLVLAGRLDGLRPPALVEPVARAIAGARFAVLETGHFMAAQTPAIVADAMMGFLAEVGC